MADNNQTFVPMGQESSSLNVTGSDYQIFQGVVIALNKYGLPAIILVGIVGNSISLVVFLGSHIRYQSSSVYLAFLNVVDIVFLLCVSPIWLGWLGVYLIHKTGWCQLIVYLSYVSAFLSVWTVVAFTVERFLVVYYPLRRHKYCTRRRSIIVVVCLAGLALLLYSFSLWTTGLLRVGKKNVCLTSAKYEAVLQIISTIDTFITLFVPSVLIIVLNVLIGYKVWRFLHFGEENECKEEVKMVVRCEAQNGSAQRSTETICVKVSKGRGPRSCRLHPGTRIRRHPSPSLARPNSIQIRTTRTLLIISSVFVILNLPSHAFRVGVTIRYLTSDSMMILSRNMLLWQQVFQMLYYANFSTNIFLYCSCSQSFRIAIKRLSARLKRKGMACMQALEGRIRSGRQQEDAPATPRLTT